MKDDNQETPNKQDSIEDSDQKPMAESSVTPEIEPSESRSAQHDDLPESGMVEPQKRKKRGSWVLLLLLLLFIGIGSGYYISSQKGLDLPTGSLDSAAKQKVAESIVPPISIDIPGYPKEITLEADLAEASIDFTNPETNTAYLTFELVIGDTKDGEFHQKEVLYASDLIEPGLSVDHQALSRALEEGTYDAAINIQAYTYDPETKAVVELNGAQNTVQFNVVNSK